MRPGWAICVQNGMTLENFAEVPHASIWLNCKMEVIMTSPTEWELNELGCRKQRLQYMTEEEGVLRITGRDI